MKRTRGTLTITLLALAIFALGCVEPTPADKPADKPAAKTEKPVQQPPAPQQPAAQQEPLAVPASSDVAVHPGKQPEQQSPREEVPPPDGKPTEQQSPIEKPEQQSPREEVPLAAPPVDRRSEVPAPDGKQPEQQSPKEKVAEIIAKATEPAEDGVCGASGPVKVEILPQFGLVKKDQETTLNVLVRLTADKAAAPAQRTPLDLAIILDRSGSMRGDKVRQVKQAAMELIDKLDRTDRVTLITYASDVAVVDRRLVMDGPAKEKLKKRIANLWAGGSTALGPALFDGLDILQKAEREETDIAHVFLLSDGIANVGESRPEMLGARTASAFAGGVSVSTLGVGLDYNEDLMTRIADQGGGRYHFIKDADAIAGVLNDEMAGLSTTVARSIVLTFKPKDGIKLDTVFGYPVWEEDDETRVKVGTLYSGQTREILVRFKLSPAAGEKLALGDLGLKFVDVTNDGEKVRDEFSVTVGLSEDDQAIRESERAEVTIRVAEVESADAMEKAARAVDRGDYHAARSIISGSIGRLREQNTATPSVRLEAQMDEMEGAMGGVGAAETSADDRKDFIKRSKAKSYDLKK
jgi:Ca-activated chloride channel family protein